ncbi:MAG: urease accessory protein UreE [Methylocella sp.]
MLEIEEYASSGEIADESMTLPFELRKKSRMRAILDSGAEAAVVLERGRILRSGDLLRASNGSIVEVRAAAEAVSTVRSRDILSLMRGAYHLGNRHVPLQVGDGFLRYQRDHVLDDMVRQLGLEVAAEMAPFEPEPGAYGGGHGHSDGHGHSHSHGAHAHHHPHDHE